MRNRDREIRRLRAEIENLGKEPLIRAAVKRGDPASLCGLIEVLQLTSSEAVDLIAAFLTLRSRGFPFEDLQAWKKRARSCLQRLVGDSPEADRPPAN
jgi:hypothetical protein